MVRFLHTADWQLGMTRHFLRGEAQANFSAARLNTIEEMGNLAINEGCQFVVVCGDVFESNQVERKVIARAFEKMSAVPKVTFYLLPGNHDPLDASSIYRSSTFTARQPDNVQVLDGPTPVRPGAALGPGAARADRGSDPGPLRVAARAPAPRRDRGPRGPFSLRVRPTLWPA